MAGRYLIGMEVIALSQKLLGRVAALMFVAAGLADLCTRPLSHPEGVNTPAIVAIDVTIIIGGAMLFFVPWQRWRRSALLIFVPIALVCVAFRNWALGPDNPTYAMYFVVTTAWVGVAFRSGTARACAPLIAGAYIVPLMLHHEPLGPGLGYAVVTVSVCVVVGEALAWLAARLRTTEKTDAARLQDMQRLVGASEDLARGLDSSNADDTVSRLAKLLLRARGASVILLPLARAEEPEESAEVAEARSEGRLAWGYGGRSLAVPLTGTAGVIGVIEVRGLRRDDGDYTADLARAFATQVALALERLWGTESLIDASLRDELTGLGNRRSASAALGRVAPDDALVMIDLDLFKRVNDEFGHAAGDDVLRRLGSFLREAVRDADTCARYGGEEFVLVLRQAGDRARDIIDRLREDWNATLPPTTFSAGIAVHRAGRAPGATLRLADAALYEAKRAGRDRVISDSNLPPGSVSYADPSFADGTDHQDTDGVAVAVRAD